MLGPGLGTTLSCRGGSDAFRATASLARAGCAVQGKRCHVSYTQSATIPSLQWFAWQWKQCARRFSGLAEQWACCRVPDSAGMLLDVVLPACLHCIGTSPVRPLCSGMLPSRSRCSSRSKCALLRGGLHSGAPEPRTLLLELAVSWPFHQHSEQQFAP